MVRHSLLYLLAKDEPQPRLAEWPEIGTVEFASSEECYLDNFCMGGPFESTSRVISLSVHDLRGLQYITECLTGVHVVAVRGASPVGGVYDDPWWERLHAFCMGQSVVHCAFDRHEIVAALGKRAFWDGIELLQLAVEHLRSPAVQASAEAMRSETTLTRAIEALTKTGYQTPRR